MSWLGLLSELLSGLLSELLVRWPMLMWPVHEEGVHAQVLQVQRRELLLLLVLQAWWAAALELSQCAWLSRLHAFVLVALGRPAGGGQVLMGVG